MQVQYMKYQYNYVISNLQLQTALCNSFAIYCNIKAQFICVHHTCVTTFTCHILTSFIGDTDNKNLTATWH